MGPYFILLSLDITFTTQLSLVMEHPSGSPSHDGSARVHSSPNISKSPPSVISGAGPGAIQSQNNRSAGHHVQWSDPLVSTRGIPAREPQGANLVPPAVTPSTISNHSSQLDTRTIAGAMEGLHLTSVVSTPSTTASLHPQLTTTFQVAPQNSFMAAPLNPNLRFIFSRRLLAAQASKPFNPTGPIVIDEKLATTGNICFQ